MKNSNLDFEKGEIMSQTLYCILLRTIYIANAEKSHVQGILRVANWTRNKNILNHSQGCGLLTTRRNLVDVTVYGNFFVRNVFSRRWSCEGGKVNKAPQQLFK